MIAGNHADRDGNPVPKLKMTGRQHWTEKAHAYVEWKEYVRLIFKNTKVRNSEGRTILVRDGRITLNPQQAARMDLKIWWANEHHGDPENIFGSIADALFENDKHLNGSFEAEHHPDKKGRVEVTITIT